MSLDPMDPVAVAHEIARLTELLEQRTLEYKDDIHNAAVENARYKGEWARAMLTVISGSSKTTVSEREARTEVETNDRRIVAEVADAQAKATKEALTALRTQLDGLRSLGANLRVQT